MKKLSILASVLLASAALMTSCNDKDNPVIEEPKTVIELDGQQYETDLVASLYGEVGKEVSLTIGVYDRYDIYGVDFGDGNIVADTVCFENGGLRDEEGAEVAGTTHKNATVFTGTVAGEGTIKVYGKSDIWLLSVLGNAVPAEFREGMEEKIQNLQLSGLNVDGIDFSKMSMLTSLSVNNSPISYINVSKNAELKSLTILCTSQSEFEPQLKSIDLSGNPKLEYLNLGSSFYKPGQLTSIDLSNNPALETIIVGNQKLTSITLPAGAKVSQLSLEQNELTELDLSVLGSLKGLQVNDNQLKSLDLSKMIEGSSINVNVSNNQLEELNIPVTVRALEAQNNKLKSFSVADATYSCKLENNQLTLATLPKKPAGLNSTAKTKRFTYAPQAALQVPEEVAELDLSDQLTAQGILDAPATTAYSFVTVSGTALVEGTDYTVTAPGKFKFTKAQSDKVYGVMTNEGFPLFTGDNAFKTTEFTVKAAAAAGQTWNFTVWSAATVANLKADAAASKVSGWSDVEKKADAEAGADPTDISKDNCFWLQGTVGADGSLSANGQIIEELKGLKFDSEYAGKRSLAIAVNYPEANVSSGFGPYAGPAYLWLGGGGSKQACPCFTIPGVKAGQKLTVVMESHKVSDARGIQIYANSYDAANQIGAAFKPTTQDTYTWTIDQDCDVVVWNTSGCHIYTMTVE
jgi:hypothetical protein